MKITFKLNNQTVHVEADGNERLSDILRTAFRLKSMKKNCRQGICGSCTVLFNNIPVPSCMIPVFAAEGKEIITLELFETGNEYAALIAAFESKGITLCGFCNASVLFTAYHLLTHYKNVTDEQIRNAYLGTVCRCTDINSLTAALKIAARTIRAERNKNYEG